MASDYLLKIEGIKGESTDSKHKDEIEIESFSWGATQPGTFSTGGGGGAGKVSFQDLHFTSRVSVASPNLMVACASGQHIKVATLTVRKAGKEAAGILHRQTQRQSGELVSERRIRRVQRPSGRSVLLELRQD